MESAELDGPFVVRRDEIPLASEPDVEVRSFAAHPLLAKATAEGVDMAWMRVPAGERAEIRQHQRPCLLVVLGGSARLLGTKNREIEAGDVVTLPSNHEYGFSDVREPLHMLQVMLPDEHHAENGDQALTLERLLSRNEARVRRVLDTPFFVLLRTRALDTPKKRASAREAIRVFSDAFQTLLFTRQALCRNEQYLAEFHSHLVEELDHNRLLSVSGNSRITADPILRAASSWFCHKMLILDNAGKATVNLALETGGYHFHTLAKPVFSSDESARYFDVHAEDDEHHKELAIGLLKDQHPDTYRRLLEILDESWDMIEVMTGRFARLIDIESASS
jgi:mannose-6-phosphate isomerase-like protein (cupin superfamily)